ncbi:MAG TPA: c-type cytochrome [Ideonella sp.]|uniref:c-type cytochrome n=1 Tax=Ideonella sp. TaxID=1929293 RepID=UPI002BE35540|nr:c-type cytochrome [Ideonella sp.]HSI48549.1 c-type cytochrome [Ideonella sp.]
MQHLKFWVLALLGLAACRAHAAGDAVAGKAAFAPCASCHQVGPSARAGFGPQLNGIIGRPAGATADYTYSAAMKNSKIVWTEQTLAAFIKDQNSVVPGTRMRFASWGYGDQKIADLLAYLRTFQAR